jgi:hypothetical protein
MIQWYEKQGIFKLAVTPLAGCALGKSGAVLAIIVDLRAGE